MPSSWSTTSWVSFTDCVVRLRPSTLNSSSDFFAPRRRTSSKGLSLIVPHRETSAVRLAASLLLSTVPSAAL